MSRTVRTVFLVVILFSGRSLGEDVTPEERLLKDQSIAVDGAGLLKYIRSQTPSPDEQARLAEAVTQLGHRSFAVREKATRQLIAAGRTSVSFLLTAVNHADLEVSRRAQRALDEIDRVSETTVMTAALQVIARKRPTGAAEVLLAYLPFSREEAVEEAVRESLGVVGLEKGKPVPCVTAALSDREPRLRAAAAFVLGRAPSVPVKELMPLLKDANAEVRFQAAQAVLFGRDRSGGEVLVALLEQGSLPLARRAEEVLFQLAGEKAPSASLGLDDASRRACREAWQGWWEKHGEKVDLAKLTTTGAPLGLTLLCLYDSSMGDGRVILNGPDGKPRWEFGGLQGPNDARLLPGGRVLVAERNASRVTERDSTGRVLWEKRVDGGALSALRMPGGNTLVATWSQLLEVSPDGKTVWSYSHPGGFRHASLLKTGRVLAVAASGQVLELDRAGKLLRTITPERHGAGAGYWASIEQLSAARFLVAYGSSRKVVEMDEAGKVLTEMDAPNAVFATRLTNGHTLVCCFEECEVLELDRSGREVSRQKLAGRPFSARRY